MTQIETRNLEITVVDDGGSTAQVEVSPHSPLHELLHRGLKALLGEHRPTDDEFEVVIAGAAQSDLSKTLEEVGLRTGSEVALLRKNMPRG